MIRRLYIIGPVTGIENDNHAAFQAARDRLRREYIVDIPHDTIKAGTAHEDAMTESINLITTRGYSYPRGGMAKRYDGVALLEGWEQSEGARLEKAVAEACGIPCKTVDEWLEEAR